MRSLLIALLFFFIGNLAAQNDSISAFGSLKLRSQINIEIPVGYKKIDVEFLHKIPHHFVIGSTDTSCQVRYWIRPLDTWVADYNKKSDKQKKNSMHPNALCKSLMMLAVLDVSNNKTQDYQISQYLELTKKAYNADWEAATIVETGWPQVGYKYCYIWCLHKDNVGDIFIYILFNNDEDLARNIGKISPLVKFK